VPLEHHPVQAGDVVRTGGATAAAEAVLGWRPATTVEEGLARQFEWHVGRRGTEG
jgi:nucleoside-diphosphate-sugar epimerase